MFLRSAATCVAIALVASACGSDATNALPTTTPIATEPTTEAPTTDTPIVGDGAPEPAADRDGLALRIRGTISESRDGAIICPGDARPCLAFEGPISLASGDRVWVAGRLVGGVFEVDDQRPLPPDFIQPDYSNRCPDLSIEGSPSPELLEGIYVDESQQPEGFVDIWESEDGVVHFGVAGDPATAEAFLEDLGLTDQLCLVTDFPYTDQVLATVQQAVVDVALARGFESLSASRDGWEGTVTLFVPRSDQDMRETLDEVSAANDGVQIDVVTGVEVISGSLDDYDAALAEGEINPDPTEQLTATCGAVTFSAIPPDLDEFSPLDDDAQTALDDLLFGPTGGEAEFLGDMTWSIASRTDIELVLFGQPTGELALAAGETSLSTAQFAREDEVWTPRGWGGCRLQIQAPGFGSATVAIDSDNPPQAGDTELMLLINEQNCANGQAPVDREVVMVPTETADSVSIVALVAPVEGGADCPGNPWHPVTVTLDAPLGDRQLVDARTDPPQPITPANDLN